MINNQNSYPIYNQYPYTIFNQTYVEPSYLQQIQRNKFWKQQKKIGDMVKAISDYFEASRGLEREYQDEAIVACLAEIARQMEIDRQRMGGMR